MSVRGADLMRLFRHQLGKSIDRSGDPFGEHHAGIVCRRQHDAIEQLVDRDGLTGTQIEF